ncbi:MAG: DUF342 domain-containing protein [Nitrospirae bacterium]|nr:MAG: DUF342 domain-containing protein [Nitrospirota bacterium]
MLKKIKVSEAKVGMVVAADVFEAAIGMNMPFIRHGVVLNDTYIHSLKNRGIVYILIEPPEGYKGAPGEVYEVDNPDDIREDILFDGRVQIKGDLAPKIKIDAGERIIVEGDVGEGCILTSATGGILIKGCIRGSKESPVTFMASQNIFVQNKSEDSVSFADIKTSCDITISGDVCDSSISARGEVKIEGKAANSRIYSQSIIKIRDCGNELGDPSVLMVKPFECNDLSQELLKIDSRSAVILKEKEKLQNVVDLIKKLGKDVEQLPQDKKIELATGVKSFKALEVELSSFQEQKADIKKKVEQYLEIKRIAVQGNIFPRSKITIGNSSLEITKKESGTAFFVKERKVVSSPYSGGF